VREQADHILGGATNIITKLQDQMDLDTKKDNQEHLFHLDDPVASQLQARLR